MINNNILIIFSPKAILSRAIMSLQLMKKKRRRKIFKSRKGIIVLIFKKLMQ